MELDSNPNDERLLTLEKQFEQNCVDPRFFGQEFLEAGDIGDADSLRARLKLLTADQRRTLVQSVDQQGCSALILAVRRNDAEVAEVLLDAGSNPNHTDNSGATACHYASGRGSVRILKLLLAARADPTKTDDRRDNPVMWASGARVVDVLLDAGISMANRGGGGKTALMCACGRGDAETAQHLATLMGSDLNAQDSAGKSAHAIAMQSGHVDIADFLVGMGAEASPNPGKMLVMKQDALFEAARRGDAAALETILKVPVNEGTLAVNEVVAGETALLLACSSNAMQAIDALLQAHADPNLADPFLGETPLHRAVLAGANSETLMLLVEARADLKQADLAGRSPVDIAASWSSPDTQDFLRVVLEVVH
eukprot:TRINITY_DN50724_c0_g1_i1.p1 TRINITY_DN50724_c0_g1~~TRINITY_DN50724_c0_g1_i1.p1  ORF type:complete len:368 (-),score=61.74 TRINITY_DN50724_c0_g1_i1:420-1523(-)